MTSWPFDPVRGFFSEVRASFVLWQQQLPVGTMFLLWNSNRKDQYSVSPVMPSIYLKENQRPLGMGVGFSSVYLLYFKQRNWLFWMLWGGLQLANGTWGIHQAETSRVFFFVILEWILVDSSEIFVCHEVLVYNPWSFHWLSKTLREPCLLSSESLSISFCSGFSFFSFRVGR